MSDIEPYFPVPPAHWLLQANMSVDTLLQVKKDFGLHGIALLLNINDLAYPKIVEALAVELENIHFIDTPKMAVIFYQIDLNESQLIANIQNVNAQNTYLLIADSILKRCFEKVYWRYKMREQ